MTAQGDRLVGLVRAALPAGETIGIAVSGGGDSTALLHLVRQAGFPVQAVTVDHDLRSGSGDEAQGVAALCAAIGVPHEVRVWTHGMVTGNLMDAARRARMGLILDWARTKGLSHVALGHTRDDQAETLLMGLARSAGLAGLSGMRPVFTEGGVTFHRPLLAAGREELRDWLRQAGHRWVDDPTNEDTRFQRVKARKALAALAPLGITAAALANVADHLAAAQTALSLQVQAAARHLRPAAGALQVGPGLAEEPAEVQRQLLAGAILWLTGADHAPRAADQARFLRAVLAGRDATLAGCRHRKGWLLREAAALGGPVPVGTRWDGRWHVAGAQGLVRALGPEGLRQCPDWRATGLPRPVLEVTPAVWAGDRLLSAPLAGWPQGFVARLDAVSPLLGQVD